MNKKRFIDPLLHKMHHSWLKAKCQAVFRSEGWEITIEEFFALWAGKEHLKGRGSENLVMTRIDPELAWSIPNVELITRIEQLRRTNQRKAEARRNQPKRTYRPRKSKDV